MKNILITGGAGFIGSNLSLKLVEKGYSVTVLDVLSEQIHGANPEKNSALYNNIKGRVQFINGNINDRKTVEKAIENQDAIIHLAAETGTGQSSYQIEKYNQTNVGGTALLLDLMVNAQHKVKKIILASSRAVYGEGKYQNNHSEIVYPEARSSLMMEKGIFEMTDYQGNFLQPLHTDEKSKLHPTSFYGLTKLQQEEMLSLVCQSIKMPYTILRYQNVYGEGQSLLNPYTGILSIFSTQILNGKEIQIFEDGLPSRDFIHIEDTVEATIRSLEKVETNQQIINVGTGIASSVLYIAQLLVEKYGRDTDLIVTGKFRLGDIRHHYAELSKMKKILDFEPQLKVSQGLEKFTQWVLQQPILENNFEKSLVEMKKKGFLK